MITDPRRRRRRSTALRHPGKASWQLLPKLDHGFALQESLKESVAHEFVGPFGEQVVQETLKWIQVQ
jgi:hypothetical protein